jgi:hypothetical protein
MKCYTPPNTKNRSAVSQAVLLEISLMCKTFNALRLVLCTQPRSGNSAKICPQV